MIAQQERRPLLIGHRLQSLIRSPFCLSRNRFFIRQRRTVGQFNGFHSTFLFLFKPLPNDPSLTACVVQADVDHQSIKPSIKTGSSVKLFDPRESAQKGLLGEVLGFFSVMREIESDPKRPLHIFPHQNFKNFALPLLTERYDLLIPKVLLSSLVHLKSFDIEPASGWV